MNRILLICPLEEELTSLVEGLTERGHDCMVKTFGRLPGFSIGDDSIILAQGGLGKATFGVRTQHLIERIHDVGLVVCAGTSGGLLNTMAIGDVVVGTETVEHDFNTAIFKKPPPRFDGHGPTIAALREAAKNIDESFSVHFGLIASGDEGIIDAKRALEVREITGGAYAVAWEGAGGARACEFSNIPFLEIRGVSDFADHAAPDEFVKNLPSTMKNVAAVISRLADVAG